MGSGSKVTLWHTQESRGWSYASPRKGCPVTFNHCVLAGRGSSIEVPPVNPARPQGRMVPDCSRSGMVAPAARTSCLDPNGVPRRTPLASMGQAKFRALAQPGKDTGLKKQGSPQAWGGRRGA